MNFLLILLGKVFIYFSKIFNLGSGSTWPGHIALTLNPNFCSDLLKKSISKKIVIAGTNGKTTTGKLIASVLEENNKSLSNNEAGANLLNGLASLLIEDSSISGHFTKDYLIFESDEFALPQILENVNPDYLICLNLFRDQLDRYGELDTVSKRWIEAIKKLKSSVKLILNADDPLVSYLGNERKSNIKYFGLENEVDLEELKHGADSIYCPRCQNKLEFTKVYFSHLGIWQCLNCKLKRPLVNIKSFKKYPLSGIYNKYNTLAAVSFLSYEKFKESQIIKGFKKFKPAFGRQEVIKYKDHELILFLSKNPTSFNESLSTIKDLNGKNLLILLNDRIPDGIDVSWIWDIGFERLLDKTFHITVGGDRLFDMALRLKYAEIFCHTEEDLKTAIDKTIDGLEKNEKLYILPNYSAMLETRKVLLGRKLL